MFESLFYFICFSFLKKKINSKQFVQEHFFLSKTGALKWQEIVSFFYKKNGLTKTKNNYRLNQILRESILDLLGRQKVNFKKFLLGMHAVWPMHYKQQSTGFLHLVALLYTPLIGILHAQLCTISIGESMSMFNNI